jgi:Flp pilus assembly protein TadG
MKMIKFKKNINLFNHKSGSVIIEFALILPILLFLFGATVEISNAVYASQKAQTAATLAGSLLASMDTINETEIQNIAKLSRKIIAKLVASTANNDAGGYALGLVVLCKNNDWNKKFKLYKYVYGSNTVLDFGFSDVVLTPEQQSGGRVNIDFAEKNELTASENALINDYDFADNEHIIIVKVAIKYKLALFKTISKELFGAGDIIFSYQTEPSTPRVFQFKFLPNGSVIPL